MWKEFLLRSGSVSSLLYDKGGHEVQWRERERERDSLPVLPSLWAPLGLSSPPSSSAGGSVLPARFAQRGMWRRSTSLPYDLYCHSMFWRSGELGVFWTLRPGLEYLKKLFFSILPRLFFIYDHYIAQGNQILVLD